MSNELQRPGATFRAPLRDRGRGTDGFTLVEMLVTVAIAIILASIAAPSYTTYMTNQRIRGATFSLSSTLLFARSEAIKRNANIDVIPANVGNWANGWTVSTSGTVLRTVNAETGMAITAAPAVNGVSFGSNGRLTTASTLFTLASAASVTGANPRCLRITLSGMPSYLTCP